MSATNHEFNNSEISNLITAWVDSKDQEAARKLSEILMPYVRGAVTRFSSDASERDDLTQDAFLQIFRKLHTFQGNSRLQSWAYAVARNEGLMRIRKKSRRPQTVELVRDVRPAMDEVSRLEARSGLRSVEQALSGMPEEKVQALRLYALDGFDIEQVAKKAGLTIAAAKSRVFRARRELSNRTIAHAELCF